MSTNYIDRDVSLAKNYVDRYTSLAKNLVDREVHLELTLSVDIVNISLKFSERVSLENQNNFQPKRVSLSI